MGTTCDRIESVLPRACLCRPWFLEVVYRAVLVNARGCAIIIGCWLPALRGSLHRRPPSAGRIQERKVYTMTISKERKAELTAQFGNSPVDTGNPKVQVAILTERIRELTEHMKSHQKDFHTRRGLLMLVGRRRRLLSYIKKNDIFEYRALIKELGIRDNIQ